MDIFFFFTTRHAMEVIILPLFSSVASKPSRDMFNRRDSSSFVETPWWEHYSATWPWPFLSLSRQPWLELLLQWPFSTLLLPIVQEGPLVWGFHRWDFVRPLPSGMHLGPCSRLPLGLHCGFCCQFLTGGLLYQWASREIVPNCPAAQPLSLGECVVPVLQHLQIMEALLLWNEVMGRQKVKIFKKGSQMEFGILDCILEQSEVIGQKPDEMQMKSAALLVNLCQG